MVRLSRKHLSVLVILAVAGFVAIAIGPYMHESDQASLLRGAIQLESGRSSPWAADFYNYDKQFGSYWILAVFNQVFPAVDRVLLGNLVSFTVFWGGLLAWLVRARVRTGLQVAALLTCVAAPAVLLHSPFLASAFLACGLMFLGWALWLAARGRMAFKIGAFGSLFLAIACRADVVLLLPLLAWLATPARPLRSLIARPLPYLLPTLAVGVLLLGRRITSGGVVDFHPPFFYPKVFAAFLVFGLGSGGLALAGNCLGMARIVLSRSRRHRLFYLLGFAALFLPTAYYAIQMFSPRYWVLTLCAQMLLVGSRRGSRIWSLQSRLWTRCLAAAMVVVTLVPLFVGIKLPRINSPRIVLSEPTLFPSADGMIPMGAFGWYFLAHRTKPEGIDHNQSTWLAARSATYEPDESGFVPVLLGNLRTYIDLALELRGMKPKLVEVDAPTFYVDRRELFRLRNAFSGVEALDLDDVLATRGVQPVSPLIRGQEIMRVDPEILLLPVIRRDAALVKHFAGAEFESPTLCSAEVLKAAADAGKSAILYAEAPFEVVLDAGARRLTSQDEDAPLHQVVSLGAADLRGASVVSEGPVFIAVSRLPQYMNLQSL